MTDIHNTWAKITQMAGTEFHTKTGKAFSYDISGNMVSLKNTNRSLPRSHFERALERMPVSGPGQLQDLQGPSYIFAILSDPRIGSGSSVPDTGTGVVSPERPTSASQRPARPVVVSHNLPERRYGTPVASRELTAEGFARHELRFRAGQVPTPYGTGTDWDTLGSLPSGPGLYAFTTEDPTESDSLKVTYVGLTTNLWMVTKGQLPGGIARGGQRYGRPKHSGTTRQRVNAELTRAQLHGLVVAHWLSPLPTPSDTDPRAHLRQAEEQLIQKWKLRSAGWNRG